MEIIRTIDLWTEQRPNHQECFNGVFVDGLNAGKPFDRFKIVKNCNCIITVDNKSIHVTNKHNSVVFYLGNKVVRLLVANKDTNIDGCINMALQQRFNGSKLKQTFENLNIQTSVVDLKQEPIYNDADNANEIDVGSCDRWNLLYNMLKGNYTESETPYGNFTDTQYEFLPELFVKYELTTDEEQFEIEHACAFINVLKTRMVPIQNNSPLTN